MTNINTPILIYDFNGHGLYYKPDYEDSFEVLTLVMGTIALEFNHKTGMLLGITGYIPMSHSKRTKVNIPPHVEGEFIIPVEEMYYLKGMAYDYFEFYPCSKEYFMLDNYNPKEYYDENNKIMLLGSQSEGDYYVRINRNIICGFDKSNNLKSLLITIDRVISSI